MPTRDSRIDDYIADAEPFARPILKTIRSIVHEACPEAVETIKWRLPFFEYKGALCAMGAFKAHVRFIFWKEQPMASISPDVAVAVVRLQRLTSAGELPTRAELIRLIRLAVDLNDRGVKGPIAARRDKSADPKPSPQFLAALAKAPAARKAFDAFPPGHRREYIKWIAEAKRAETRTRRIAQAIEWIQTGKSLNWKYERS